MEKSLPQLSSYELSALFKSETGRFVKGIDEGMSFDDLKKIRVFLRAIESEQKKRE
jgi:hypothetical protein